MYMEKNIDEEVTFYKIWEKTYPIWLNFLFKQRRNKKVKSLLQDINEGKHQGWHFWQAKD